MGQRWSAPSSMWQNKGKGNIKKFADLRQGNWALAFPSALKPSLDW